MEKNDVILKLIDVNKSFDGSIVVENFNLSVHKGEFVTFLGPSGCGKTTTLRMIAGLEMPDSGQILLNGRDIAQLPPHKRPLNTVFQRYALFPHLDVYDNIAFGLKLKKVSYETTNKQGHVITKTRKYTKDEIDAKVKKALKIVDLESFECRNVTTLSGGQQQRVAIARAIVNEPEILLLDEPLGALDLKMRKEMQLELKEMHKKLGITFIYVTHDQEEALTMSDRIVVIEDGFIQQIGTPLDIYNEPANAFVADFIGESNIYVGTMIGPKKVRFLGTTWDCVDDFDINEKVDVVVRPEDIIMHLPNEGKVKAKIVNKIFKGIHYQFTAMVGNNEVLIQSTVDHPVGQDISLTIEPDLIQIMKREYTANIYEDAYINKNNEVVFAGTSWACDVTQLMEGATLDEKGYFITPNGKKYDLDDIDVIATIDMKDIEISDNLEEGNITGQIIQMVWKGDHYQLIIRTEDEEDFIVDTEWTWNESDTVSISIDPSKIKLKLKADLSKYEI
ncbi:MAG: ABC transporter ATP-binding protein [Prevotella sp.]|nr:ABC transporter ATP-binding protein [Staphylococcus sp.]MCM1350411.1 ABC transporter ATP-binding protein [Prevotella sp.]